MQAARLLLFVFLIITNSGAVFADGHIFDNVYLKAGIGGSFSNDHGEPAFISNSGALRTFSDGDLGSSRSFDIGIGKEITKNLSLELTVNYKDGFQVEAPEISSTFRVLVDEPQVLTFFVNGLYDVENLDFKLGKNTLKPYITAGLGVANIHNRNTVLLRPDNDRDERRVERNRTNNFAWNIGFGVLTDLTNNITIDMGYRYVDLSEYEAGNNSCRSQAGVQTNCNANQSPLKTELSAHEVMVNLKYRF